jgi:hypothetical protein
MDDGLAKLAHEDAWRSGPIPVRIVRAAQFHEFVAQLLEWGTQGEIAYVPEMRTQIVSARTVAEVVADAATSEGEPAACCPAGGHDWPVRRSRNGSASSNGNASYWPWQCWL